MKNLMNRSIRLALVAAVAALLIAPAQTAFATDDMTLEQRLDTMKTNVAVNLALLEQIGVDALDIDVDVTADGIVLSGTVNERATKKLAQQTALSVDGVEKVDNRLTIETSNDTNSPVADKLAIAEAELHDSVLEGKVKSALLAEVGKHALDIEVEATDGVVMLRGEVEDERQISLALEAARGIEGVKETKNLLSTAS